MKFVFLYKGGKAPKEKMEAYMQAWNTWTAMLHKDYEKAGLRVRTGKTVSASAVTDYQGDLGGVSLIEAVSLEKALELAKGCPALHHGGTVDVLEEFER